MVLGWALLAQIAVLTQAAKNAFMVLGEHRHSSCSSTVIEQGQVTFNVLFHPGDAALNTVSSVVPGFAVYRFEYTAVDPNNRLRKQLKAATQLNELTSYPTYALAVTFPEIRNRFEIRNQPTGEPHHLDITLGFLLQSARGLNPIEITVDIDF